MKRTTKRVVIDFRDAEVGQRFMLHHSALRGVFIHCIKVDEDAYTLVGVNTRHVTYNPRIVVEVER